MAAGEETVELTIRCAFRAVSEDVTDVRLQRLIFSGSCLSDEKKIGDVLRERGHTDGRVFHLACSTPQTTELRQRRNVAPNGPTTSAEGATSPAPSINNQYSSWMAYYQQFMVQNQALPTGDYAQAYSDYYARYMAAYMQQHQHMLGAASFPAAAQQFAAGWPQQPQAEAAQIQVGVQQANNAMQGVAAVSFTFSPNKKVANVQVVDNGGEGEQQGGGADLLDRGYKLIRLTLLLFVLFIYSTIERFIFVMAVIVFVVCINLRRAQVRRVQQEEERLRVERNNNEGGAAERAGVDTESTPEQIQMEAHSKRKEHRDS